MQNQKVTPELIKRVDEFMAQEGIRIDERNNQDFLTQIIHECRAGLEKRPSSLGMLNTYTTRTLRRENQTLKLIIDAGGTNFRVVVMRFQGSVKEMLYYQRYPMPGSQGTLSKEEFFSHIVEFLEPVLSRKDFQSYDPNFNGFDTLQFCFSYPVRIHDTGEGVVTGLTKEVCIEGLIGAPLKSNLLSALHHRGYDRIQDVVILNDTTATLLAGCYEKTTTGEIDNYEGFLGIVWGTGFNIAYEENCFFSKPYIINSEAGGYNRFPMTTMDQEIDAKSHKTGEGLAEKKISGYYFGLMVKHLLEIFLDKESLKDIFSPGFQEILLHPQVSLKSEHISQFLMENPVSGKPEFFFQKNGKDTSRMITWADQNYLRIFIDHLDRRSAYLTSLMATGMMLQSLGREVQPTPSLEKKKFCLVLDGSMIRKMPGLKGKFTEYLSHLTQPYAIDFDTLETDRAPIVGTAIAAFDFS